jgi:hypothetical protein
MTTTYTMVGGYPQIDKDPDAALDYGWDWSSWLAAISDTIATYDVTTNAPALAIDSTSIVGGVVTAVLSGGLVGTTPSVTCEITTAGGRTDQRTIRLRIRQR